RGMTVACVCGAVMDQTESSVCQLHPVVLPQVSHLRQVPFLTSVKLPHSPQAPPSLPLAFASARFSAAIARALARASATSLRGWAICCCSSCSAGESFCSGSALSAAVPSARASRPANAVTLAPPGTPRAPPSPPPIGEGERASGAAPPANTESLSLPHRVSPFDTYRVAAPAPGLPSSTPLPSASKPPSVGSTWARSKRSR